MLQMQLRIAEQDPVAAPRPAQAPSGPAWLAYGFRPFFLAGSAAAVVLMALWLMILAGWQVPHPGFDPIRWHGHEMLFGFGGAVVAGFLLTAVPNWTGLPTPKDGRLGALLALWLLGRLGSWQGGGGLVLDLLFLPGLGLALAGPLVRAGQVRNLIFLPVLAMLWVSNALFWLGPSSTLALSLALYGLLLLIALIGGRVIPFFTERALSGHRPRRLVWLEGAALAGLFLSALVENWPGISIKAKLLILSVTACLHLLRMFGWGSPRALGVPLLWVLYLAYSFLPVGLCLRALAWMGWGSLSAATHALTAGCIAIMCLGMMSRVALGHTGRELKPAPITVLAFALMGASALCRSLVPFFWPDSYSHALWCAGGLWCLAFSLYFLAYWPVLTRPRVDGKPG
ncbi:NnrS family protein [bacterium]|nr:NnrS family protein [bacterium]